MIRSLGIRDLGLITRYRHRGLFLDSVPTLTWGREIVPMGALLSTFSSLTGIFTSLGPSQDGQLPLLGQVAHSSGSPHAHFTFLAPTESLDSSAMPELLEHLIAQVGSRGAHSLTADVEEEGPAFVALREAGFGIYARQHIWRLNKIGAVSTAESRWRFAEYADEMAINLLCTSLVPGLVQQVESPAWNGLRGYVLYRQGELLAYVDVRSGPRGKWLQPFVHMDAKDIEDDLTMLVSLLRPSGRLPIYLSLRSYQNWLDVLMKQLGAQAGPRQAVMVRRTARRVKVKKNDRLINREGQRAESTMQIKIPTQFIPVEKELIAND